jgi:hypothetical protein
MDGFTAILLICLIGTPVDQCDEASAVDVLSHHVSNELQCASGWQELAASLGEAQDFGTRTYARTLCRRAHPQVAEQHTRPRPPE